MILIITILPVITKDLPISPRFTPYNFLSRCKFSTLTTRQPMVEFYLLTFPRFPLRKKEHTSYSGKNRIHDFRTSRCAVYLLDHTRATSSREYDFHRHVNWLVQSSRSLVPLSSKVTCRSTTTSTSQNVLTLTNLYVLDLLFQPSLIP